MSAGPRTKVCLVGAGYISDFHRNAVRAVAGAEVTSICDQSASRASRLGAAWGIPFHTSLEAMLARDRPDVAHVLTPPHVHFGITKTLLEAGVDVFVEKPMCTDPDDARVLSDLATASKRVLGVSHNFLFSTAYEALARDVHDGSLGRIEQIDIVWNKPLGQLAGGPYGAYVLQRPDNMLFEIAPHSFAHLLHLGVDPDELQVFARDRVQLPRGLEFYRQWEILGFSSGITTRLRFSFADGYPEHYVKVHGSSASATADVELNTYVKHAHSPHMLHLDRYAAVTRAAATSLAQANETVLRFVLGKAGVVRDGGPFQRSITRAVQCFYEGRATGALDPRLAATMGVGTVALADRVRAAANLPYAGTARVESPKRRASLAAPTVLVLGATGFIGRALVRALVHEGHSVRVLVRDPSNLPDELGEAPLDVVRGDLGDRASVERALEGIEHVYHLARGSAKTWAEYRQDDVEPTLALAELCIERGVKGFHYASSIAIYYAGASAGTITEETAPREDMLRTNLYARSKVEIERRLGELARTRGLPLVVFRPGVVLGRGGHPLHWGVAGWPYPSVCRLWGDGNNLLPTVLVDDVAEALVLALGRTDLVGQSFNLVGETHLTANDYVDALERASRTTVRRVPTSSARYFAEELGKFAIKTLGRDPERRLPSYADWEGRTFGGRFDASKATRVLGWQPTKGREILVQKGIAEPCAEFLG